MEVLCLDVGDRRIGVARASTIAKLPEPLKTITVDGDEVEKIIATTEQLGSEVLVIGMPRNQSGEKTEQSTKVEAFSARIHEANKDFRIVFQDESVTTKKAEQLLQDYSKRNSTADVDQMAAVVILQDYLDQQS